VPHRQLQIFWVLYLAGVVQVVCRGPKPRVGLWEPFPPEMQEDPVTRFFLPQGQSQG